jgi:hypothetical protein
MAEDIKTRRSMNAAERLAARERPNSVARETLAEQRRTRDAKTERLSALGQEMIMDDEIRKDAYRRWEDEGRPEGQHERHWREAEEAHRTNSTGRQQTWSPAHGGGDALEDGGATSSDAVPSSQPGSFKPGELASENK